jgi:hypothetical protein
LFAPRGLVITVRGDPNSVAKDLPSTVDTDGLPAGPISPGSARGVKHIAVGMRRLSDRRQFLDLLGSSPDQVRIKLLTHSGRGNVSVLLADTPHAKKYVSTEAARVTIRQVTGVPSLGRRQCVPREACSGCDTRGNAPESLEQHAIRCLAKGVRAFIHVGLISTLQKVLR